MKKKNKKSPKPSPKPLLIYIQTKTSLQPSPDPSLGSCVCLPKGTPVVLELTNNPQPITLIAEHGQEIRIVSGGSTTSGYTFSGDSDNTSPAPSR